MEDFNFDVLTTRSFKLGKAELYYTDNGVVRKARLYYDEKLVERWKGTETTGRWLSTAVYEFTQQLDPRGWDKLKIYQVYTCLGLAITGRNSGRYWQDYSFPGTVAAAINVCQNKTGRVFGVKGSKVSLASVPNKTITAAL